jgi:hypothetical protein
LAAQISKPDSNHIIEKKDDKYAITTLFLHCLFAEPTKKEKPRKQFATPMVKVKNFFAVASGNGIRSFTGK